MKKSVIKSDLTHKEKIALAIVSSGRSYDDAARVMNLWVEIVSKEEKK